jgi:hypothetical protein
MGISRDKLRDVDLKRNVNMRLVSEELPEIEAVTAEQIERVIADAVFGKFVILSNSDDEFIQAGECWSWGPPYEDAFCQDFLKRTGSEPYVLEYRDSSRGKLYRATKEMTDAEVKAAFVAYLHDKQQGLTQYDWIEVR